MLSTSDAAARLGVTPTRVRALIAAGTLVATRFGDRWVVDENSLSLLESGTRRAGHRAFTPRVAWAAAALLDGRPEAWLSSSERVRLENRLAARVDAGAWVARLRRRAVEVLDVRVHETVLKRFITDERVHRSDPATLPGDRLVGGTRVNVWIAENDLSQSRTDFGLLASTQPNLRVRVAPSAVMADTGVPRLIVAADLWDEGDARSQQAAAEFFVSLG